MNDTNSPSDATPAMGSRAQSWRKNRQSLRHENCVVWYAEITRLGTDWTDMSNGTTGQRNAFTLFSEAAERYCVGLSNPAMRKYALQYFAFLQSKAQGQSMDEPKNGRASSFDCVLIRSYLTKLYRDTLGNAAERAA